MSANNIEEPADSEVAHTAIHACIRLANLWQLTDDQLNTLTNAQIDTDLEACAQPESFNLADDSLVRISHLLNIHAALRQLFSGESAYGWVHRPNSSKIFGGQTALSVMLSGDIEDLELVDRYLQGQTQS